MDTFSKTSRVSLSFLFMSVIFLCSFCNLCDKTRLHIFYECDSIKCLWSDLVHYFQNSLVLSTLTPQAAIFGFLDSTNSDYNFKNNKLLINHILPIFKLYVYRSREKQFIHINNIIAEIKSGKAIERDNSKKITLQVTQKRQ